MIKAIHRNFGKAEIDGASVRENRVAEAVAKQLPAQPPPEQIPKFFFPRPSPGSLGRVLTDLLNKAVSERLLIERDFHDICEVEALVGLLHRNALPLYSPTSPPEQADWTESGAHARISIVGFNAALEALRRQLGRRSVPCMAHDIFFGLPRAADGSVSVPDLVEVLHTFSFKTRCWTRATAYDGDHDGMLTFDEVSSLIADTAHDADFLPAPPLWKHWMVIAPRKVFFLHATGSKVPIKALVGSDVLDDLNGGDPCAVQPTRPLDWFAPEKSAAIVQRFEELRGDNASNVLFPHQLMHVRQAQNPDSGATVSSMAPYFVERVFEVHVRTTCPVTGRPGMSLHDFADFLLAWNYRGFLPSTKYFFRVLDVENTGALSAAVVNAWCDHVRTIAYEKMAAVYDYCAADVKDEIFDMIKPKDVGRGITIAELMASKLSDTICGILVDGQCHFDYDQREALQQQAQEE